MNIKQKLREKLNEHLSKRPMIIGLLDDYIFGYLSDGIITEDIQYILKSLVPEQKFVFESLLKMCDEIKKYDLDTGDLLNVDNWGFKPNGNLALFDIGFGNWFSEFDKQPKDLSITENKEKLTKFTFLAQKIAEKLKLKDLKYLGSGLNGYAFQVNDNKVLKITKDKSEAVNSHKILKKKLNHIANIYEIYKFNFESNEYFVIILEKLDTSNIKPIIDNYQKLKLWFKKKIGK